MNAAVVHAFGSPPRYTTFDDPVPGEGEARVRVSAAGLHPVVRALAAGTHYGSTGNLPFIPGVDGVGRLEDGSRVYFGVSRSPFGSFAEQTVAPRSLCLPVPEEIDDVTLAAIANPAMSAWAALKLRANFTPGENVLILGATGVAGTLAVQIARRLGARRVIAAGRNPQALEQVSKLGADAVVALIPDRQAQVAEFRRAWADSGVDVVLDYLWGPPAESLLAAISQKGLDHPTSRIRFIQVGTSAAPTITLAGATLRSSGLEILGSGFGSASLADLLQAVGDFFKEGARTPFAIDHQAAPLRDVERLWSESESGARWVFQP